MLNYNAPINLFFSLNPRGISFTFFKWLLITIVGTTHYNYSRRFLTTQQLWCHGNKAPEDAALSIFVQFNLLVNHLDIILSVGSVSVCSMRCTLILWWAQLDISARLVGTSLTISYTVLHSWVPWYYVTQHHPLRPCTHYPSPPTQPPTNASLAIWCRGALYDKSTSVLTQTVLIVNIGRYSFGKHKYPSLDYV